jgi:curved DNA-binding protein CbpA
MIDYYEFLQISPNADLETVHRVYRYLAARFHPDNPTTANPEQFKLVRTAYDVLSDRMKRAEYDAARMRQRQEPFSSSVDFMDTLEGELNRRLAVLAVLYRRRRTNPQRPEVTLAEIEERLGFPRDYLDFTMWYLNKKGYIAKADNAEYTLTAEGVDFVEGERPASPNLNKMLTSGSEPTAEEIEKASQEAAVAVEAAPEPTVEAPAPGPTPIILPSSMNPADDQRFGNQDRRVGKVDLRKFKFERRFNNLKDRRVDPNGRPVSS